jgi:hypothetical protein
MRRTGYRIPSFFQLPAGCDPMSRYPVIFIFHGGGKSVQSVKDHWQGPVMNKHLIKVYLQSYRHFDNGSSTYSHFIEHWETFSPDHYFFGVRLFTNTGGDEKNEIIKNCRYQRGTVLSRSLIPVR